VPRTARARRAERGSLIGSDAGSSIDHDRSECHQLTLRRRARDHDFAGAGMNGGQGSDYDKRQRAYVIIKESDTLSFELDGSQENPVMNPCFVIKNWDAKPSAQMEIDGKKQVPCTNFRQGIIRDTHGTKTMIIWIRQTSYKRISCKIY